MISTVEEMITLKRVRTATLEIAYEDNGPEAGYPVLLMHGFPYDPRCYDEAVQRLVAAGYPTCAVTARHGFSPRKLCAPASKRR